MKTAPMPFDSGFLGGFAVTGPSAMAKWTADMVYSGVFAMAGTGHITRFEEQTDE